MPDLMQHILKSNLKNLEKKYWAVILGGPILAVVAIFLLLINFPFTSIVFLLSVGVIAIAAPFFAFGYLEFVDIKRAEESYPNFLRDLTQSVNSGMTIPQAIGAASQTDYGALSKYVHRLDAWLKWDLPFPKAWRNFTNLLKKSELVKRINGIVLESFEAGGDIGAILLSLSEDVDTIKQMEADKRSTMLQHLGVMYVVYFVFLGIIVTLHQILLPILFLQRFGVFSGVSFRPTDILDAAYFKNLFLLMTMMQAVCLGLIAGQITEEKLIAGFKHILIMVSIGVAIFFLLILPTKLSFDVEVVPQSLGVGQTYTIRGQVFFDEQPAGGARIEIIAPDAFFTLTADSLGEFSTNLLAPTQPGAYQVSVQMTFESTTETITKVIVVE